MSKLRFTGSTEAGRILMRQASRNLLRLGPESGGNAPPIVFNDADIAAAVEGVVAAKFRNCGQTWACANRIYVQAAVCDDFARRLEYGMVRISTGLISGEVAPFGGMKHPGQGREGSEYGLDDYLEPKYLRLAIAP